MSDRRRGSSARGVTVLVLAVVAGCGAQDAARPAGPVTGQPVPVADLRCGDDSAGASASGASSRSVAVPDTWTGLAWCPVQVVEGTGTPTASVPTVRTVDVSDVVRALTAPTSSPAGVACAGEAKDVQPFWLIDEHGLAWRPRVLDDPCHEAVEALASALEAATRPDRAGSTPTTPAGRMTEGLTSPVRFERLGGIAGRRDRLEVRPDGTVVVTTGDGRPVTRRLSEAELAAVVSAAQAVDLRALPPVSRPTAADADVFRYRVTVEGRSITTTDGQADGAVRRLVDVLTPLLSAPAPTP
jgi:hypothetical protein